MGGGGVMMFSAPGSHGTCGTSCGRWHHHGTPGKACSRLSLAWRGGGCVGLIKTMAGVVIAAAGLMMPGYYCLTIH